MHKLLGLNENFIYEEQEPTFIDRMGKMLTEQEIDSIGIYKKDSAAGRALESSGKLGGQLREKIGKPFAEKAIGGAKKTAGKTLEVLNPGQSYIQPRLEKSTVPFAKELAPAIGLGIDILAPGPGELARFKNLKGLSTKLLGKFEGEPEVISR